MSKIDKQLNDEKNTMLSFNFDDLDLESKAKKTDILSQIPSYNRSEVDSFIRHIETEVDEQKTLNIMLSDNKYADHINSLKKFTVKMKPHISEQLDRIEMVYEQLKNITNENEVLKLDKKDLSDAIASDECSDIAYKLRKIKTVKHDIKDFLEKKGLWDSII